MGDLRFNGEKYEVKTCELDGKTITYRAFEGIEYCEEPVDEIQKLNIFVPEEFYEKGEVNGYTLKTVPIFMPNSVGGYMAGSALELGKNFLELSMQNSRHFAMDMWWYVLVLEEETAEWQQMNFLLGKGWQ